MRLSRELMGVGSGSVSGTDLVKLLARSAKGEERKAMERVMGSEPLNQQPLLRIGMLHAVTLRSRERPKRSSRAARWMAVPRATPSSHSHTTITRHPAARRSRMLRRSRARLRRSFATHHARFVAGSVLFAQPI